MSFKLALVISISISISVLANGHPLSSSPFERRVKQLEVSITESLGKLIQKENDLVVDEFKSMIEDDIIAELEELGYNRARAASEARLTQDQLLQEGKRELAAFHKLHCIDAYQETQDSEVAPKWDSHADDGELLELETVSRVNFKTPIKAPLSLCNELNLQMKAY